MTPDERVLIDGLFDRVQNVETGPRDPEAQALIAQRIAQAPEASYALVQSVLVQDHALQQAYARVQELEGQLKQAQARIEDAENRAAQPQPASGGFLGGLLGGGRPSVPSAGARAQAAGGPMGAPNGFGQRGPAQGQNFANGQPQPGAPAGPWGGQQARAPMGGGGGFLQNAMATAAGVAGGALLFSGIQSLMSGGEGPIAQQAAAENGAAGTDAQAAATPDAPPADTAAADDTGWNAEPQQASWDDSGSWDDGGFDGGDDWA